MVDVGTGKEDLRRHWRQRRGELLLAAQAPLLAQALSQIPPLLPPGRHLGIYWPLAGEPDLRSLHAVLPRSLAYDRRGYRLGFGGGWYDRLRAVPAWRSLPALVVAPWGCCVDHLPVDPWDVPFDGWLSERGLEWLHRVEPGGS